MEYYRIIEFNKYIYKKRKEIEIKKDLFLFDFQHSEGVVD